MRKTKIPNYVINHVWKIAWKNKDYEVLENLIKKGYVKKA